MPETAPNPEIMQPDIHFFYVEHGTEAIGRQLGEKLLDYDVIAIEYVTGKDQRQEAEMLANAITQAHSDDEAEGILYDDAKYFGLDAFKYGLMKTLAGSRKRVVLVDANREELPDTYDAIKKLETAFEKTPSESPDYLEGMYKVAHYKMAQDMPKRNALVVQQIADIAKWMEPGQRLAVMQGAAHTGTYHQLHRQGANVSREFLSRPRAASENTKYTGMISSQIRRQIEFHPEKPVDQKLWDRELIETYAFYATFNETFEESRVFLDRLEVAVAKMDADELKKIIEQIDAVREANTHNGKPDEAGFRKAIVGILEPYIQ